MDTFAKLLNFSRKDAAFHANAQIRRQSYSFFFNRANNCCFF